jgi:hypothetical protein
LAFSLVFSVIHSQVVQAAGGFHGGIGHPRLLVAKDFFDNPTSFHPGDGVFHADPKPRQLVVGVFLSGR